MNLPTKDKYGNPFITYSQIYSFLTNEKEYINTYILKKPFYQNKYIRFGSMVDDAITKNDFSKFNDSEIITLKSVTRLDLFQKRVHLKFDEFYLTGKIDSISSDYKEIIDYKTGSEGKEEKYIKDNYNQLQYYALGIIQEFNVIPEKATVEFITRLNGSRLTVSDRAVLRISCDISEKRLTSVYEETILIAKEIEKLYNSMGYGNS